MNRNLIYVAVGFVALGLGILIITCSPGVYLDECPDGIIVDDECLPANCENRDCPEGFVCDAGSGECVQINCMDVDCPEGTSCANGVCYPNDCETRTCPGLGEVCVDDECVSASCVGVECGPDERCAQGVCYPVDCETKICPGYTEVCVDDECVEATCVGVTCPEGEICAGGNCYPANCSDDVDCFGEGEVCIDGVCQRTSCVDVECPPGQACANGWCLPEDCPDEECSDYGEVCYEGECVHADCVGVVCDPGEHCARGQCFPIDCNGVICEPPYVCYEGECVRSNCVGVQCPAGQQCADGECYPIDCTEQGCGQGEVCLDGECVPDDCVHVQCPPGEVCAADLNCYPVDCGDPPCNEYEVCVNGECVDQMCVGITCPGTQVCVAGQCYETTDCGGVDCQPGEVCENDVCIPEECANWRCCPPYDCTESNQCEQYECDEGVVYTCNHDGNQPIWGLSDACTDLDPCTINDTCTGGTCVGTDMPCDPDEICVDGICRCGGTGPDCVGNETCCTYDNSCYDLDTDLDNCGACDAPCRRDHATPQCVGGVCSIASCDALWDDCNGVDDDGCETSLETLTDCGSCGNPCQAAGATVSCAGGTCHITDCDPLMGDCDGNVDNGCEASLETLEHCGACNTPCARDHATATCPGGNCQIDYCDPLYDDCNSVDPDGCEVSLETLTDCGSCGTPCSRAHATADCTGGTCHIGACDVLWDDCNATDSDGCETSLETLTDCGTCGINCDRVNATPDCTGGTCHIDSCDALWGDCNGVDADGCEEALTSLTHCGACSTPCALDHASEECSTGTCLIVACDALWDDCNSSHPDGCETSLETLTDCGGCGVPCGLPHAQADCTGGTCTVGQCEPLWDDCNGVQADGCETSLETLTDCGTCNTPCSRPNATADCTGGTCHIGVCDALWGDCNLVDADGCEEPLTSLVHCGGCGVACDLDHASEECSTGVCLIDTCDPSWDDCNSNDADGCETDLDNDDNNCGSCGFACNQNATCNGGSCQCLSGYANCNGNWGDGCETTLGTVSDCSACGDSCVDGNPCTDDVCVSIGAGCNNPNNSEPCDDNIFCNGTDTCSGGSCSIHAGDPCPGPDGDGDCSETCNESADDCSTADPNGTACDDGQFCTVTDTCSGGTCVGSGDPCPGPDGDGDCTESCNEGANDCTAADPNGSACNDGQFCTVTDTCSSGSCTGSGDPCPGPDGDGDCTESCNEGADDCTAADPNGSACDDGTFCNGNDTCSSGSCSQHGGDPCPGPDGDGDCSESCNESADNCTSNDPNGSGCDDGLFCTVTDTCSAGTCSGTGDPCPGPDGDSDCSESCNESADSCTANDPNGTACNDGQFCTVTDTCSGGACVGSGDPCPGPDGDGDCTESCNEGADDCTAADPNGSACNDGQFCTVTDTCSSGSCTGSGDPCPGPDGDGDCSESCNESTDSCTANDPNGSACDDGTFCNGSDTCSSGSCNQHGGDPCSGPDGDGDCSESCNEGSDNCTASDPNGSFCDDGAFCNGSDTCSGGSCSSHTGDPCPGPDGDGDCTESCNEGSDNCTAADPNGSACNDGQFCTITDTCSGGACVGSGDPCPGPDGDSDCSESCNESGDNCTANDPNGSACDDGAFCNGTETCSSGSCGNSSGDPCAPYDDADCWNGCNEGSNNCTADEPNGSQCGNGLCQTGICQCSVGCYDIDASGANGCECCDSDGTNDTCANSTNLGTISGSQSVQANGSIYHRSGYATDVDCFVATHETTTPAVNSGVITISLSGSRVAFDVWKNGCSSNVCSGDTTFSSDCASLGPICETDNDGTYYVCVRAAAGQDNVCESYTLTFQSSNP